KVSVHDSDRKVQIVGKTDRTGRYLFRTLSPGNYIVSVEAVGFETLEMAGVTLDVNASVSADAKLTIQTQRDSVSVVTDDAFIRAEDATVGLTLNRKAINDLPLVTRNPFDLAFLAPGVSQAPGTTYGNGVSTPGFVTNFVSAGSRNAQGDLLLDG